jgi:hypothetical protein
VANDFIATIGTDQLVDTFFYSRWWSDAFVGAWLSEIYSSTIGTTGQPIILPRDTFVIPAATEVWIDDPMDEPYLHEDEFWGQNLDTATAYYETIDDAVTDSIAVVGVKVGKECGGQ